MNRILWITLVVTGVFGCSKEEPKEFITPYAKFKDNTANVPYSSGKLTAIVAWANTAWEIVSDENQGWVTDVSQTHGGDSGAGERTAEVVFTYKENLTGKRRKQEFFVLNLSTQERIKFTIIQGADNAIIIQLNPSNKYQAVEGIGGGVANYEGWYCEHPNKKELFDLIFKDLEVSMIRIGNWYEKIVSNENPAMLKQQKEIMDAAIQRLGRSNFSVMMSNWLVTPNLIDRPKEKGATLKRNDKGEYMYEEFGEWCRETLEAYQAADIAPDYLSMMNEPDGSNSGGSKICLGYGADDSKKANYGKALEATYEVLKGMANRPKLIGPEVLGIGYGTFSNYYKDLNPDFLDAAAFHCYHGGNTSDYKDNDRYSSAHAFKSEFQNLARLVGNKSIMMTENCSYHPTVPKDAVNIAHFISNSFRYANATVYLHWALLWGYANADDLKAGGDGCVAVEWPWSSSRWTTEKGYVVRSEFYGLKHFTKHVKPGWQRIGVDYELNEVEAVAFQSPNENQITVVLINYSEQEEKTVRLKNAGDKEVSSIKKVIQTDTQKESWYQELKNTDPFIELMLPKMSVTTVYFKFKTN
ncbi:glycoside hydrolase family 30 beta sandwich domain-containing protein [uncultured Bacteroides sp.]|uniref:glycoside hydrolase family 30 beta sandwich domain-containing protein n=1 Tax=uncultured Bacteroides sp. TaxID=162156 RepID=UPI0025DFC6E3|nr:glycoside hydrolase family 30 beta sandwich domain-containing protein [uncultured Bacteroides sp.]